MSEFQTEPDVTEDNGAAKSTPVEEEKKPEPDPKKLRPLHSRDHKQVKHLRKGVRKFLHYHSDLIPPESEAEIEQLERDLDATLEDGAATRWDLEQQADRLTKTCETAVPGYKYSALRENLEILFVAVVLAMAIRAYVAQPSRIPTGSMQPTLNGIISYPTAETAGPDAIRTAPPDYEPPTNAFQRWWDKVWFGRTHVNVVSDQTDGIVLDGTRFSERNEFLFFPRTYLTTTRGRKFKIPGTKDSVRSLLNHRVFPNPASVLIGKVEEGTVIAQGYVDSGDWLLVDRFTYHWRKPKRDDVFVFTTGGIQYGEVQHFIKRCVGIPGDRLEIESPRLLVNGEPASEPGIRRVMSAENGYSGYQRSIRSEFAELPPEKYFALGDNSSNSSDSRDWGHVPAQNVVGRALFVYYPFGHHFGPVR
ncbi:MAG: signal peptidase I [Verrucomicrobiales bacterium]|nr:signal peptidase I [Verrucomicrobiales bacterium]